MTRTGLGLTGRLFDTPTHLRFQVAISVQLLPPKIIFPLPKLLFMLSSHLTLQPHKQEETTEILFQG